MSKYQTPLDKLPYVELTLINGIKVGDKRLKKVRVRMAIAEDALEAKREAFHRQLSRKLWAERERKARQWDALEQTLLLRIESWVAQHGGAQRTMDRWDLTVAPSPWALVLGLVDVHYGRRAWRGETGEDYNRDVARDRVFDRVKAILRRASPYGRPDRIILPIGNDFLDADTWDGTTTKGTRQDTDGSWTECFVSGLDLLVDLVDTLRHLNPVELVLCPGNHDRTSSVALMAALKAWYRTCADVTTSDQWGSRNYTEYGNNLLLFDHGDEAKTGTLPGVMAAERRRDWGSHAHCYLFTAHYHHDLVKAYPGAVGFQLPSISSPNRWEAGKGFVGTRRGLDGFAIDREAGVFSILMA